MCRPCRNGWRNRGTTTDDKHNPFKVAPGQVWVSLDPRDTGREIEVLEVDIGTRQAVVLSRGERRRRVKLNNFTKLKGRGFTRKC